AGWVWFGSAGLRFADVAEFFVDDVAELAAWGVGAQVGQEQVDEGVGPAGGVACREGGDEDVGHVPQRGVLGQGFGVEDVEGGAGDAAVLQGGGEGWFVDEFAAADVDDAGGGFAVGEDGVVDEVPGLVGQGCGEDEVVVVAGVVGQVG